EIGGHGIRERRLLVGSEDDSQAHQQYVRSWSRMRAPVHPVVRVVVAIVAIGVVAGVANFLDADLTVAALLLLVTVLALGTLGLAAGLTAAAAGFLALNWFFTEPTGSLKIEHGDDVVALIVFLASAALVGWIVQRLAHLGDLAQQREAE